RKPTSAITIAASSVARTPLNPASTTMSPTTSIPNRSIATIRSGNVGPFTKRTKAMSSATPSVTSVICDTIASMDLILDLFEQQLDAACEAVLDLSSRLLSGFHVHDVHVERPAVVRQIDGHAAGRDVDEHREQQNLSVPRNIQR